MRGGVAVATAGVFRACEREDGLRRIGMFRACERDLLLPVAAKVGKNAI